MPKLISSYLIIINVSVTQLSPRGGVYLIAFPLRDSNSHSRLQRPVSYLLDEAELYGHGNGARTRNLQLERLVSLTN